ncbi:MAG: HD domain-containing protein, partial [Clostridia bacterium]|nr:HD domain-containing protein [Clostridia bacterium]
KLRAENGLKNYSSEVLPILKEKYGDIIYLIGGDSFEYFETWHEPENILKVCKIAVAGRDGFSSLDETKAKYQNKYGLDNFIFLDFVGKEISSSNLKAKLLLGEDVDCLADGVKEYIKSHNLFKNYVPFVEKVHSYQEEELFDHTKNVVLCAVDINSRHNLKQDFDEVFLAALLHDNAKRRLSLDNLDVPIDAVGTPVLHQFLGAAKAERDFGITNEKILDAIKYHTTAKADMSVFEKLIYTADSTSYDRMYEPIPALRKIVDNDFEEGFKAVLKYTYDKMVKTGKSIYPLTVDAYEYYFDNIAKNNK